MKPQISDEKLEELYLNPILWDKDSHEMELVTDLRDLRAKVREVLEMSDLTGMVGPLVDLVELVGHVIEPKEKP